MSGALRILNETKIDVDEAGRRMGPDGKPLHFTSVYRAMKVGRVAPDGDRIFLEHLSNGGRLITSVEAVDRYMAKLNGIDQDEPGGTEHASVSTKRRQRDLDRVDRELDAAGL